MRDMVMAAVLGAGPMADAFFVAFRLPNHFRAIFAEGAFNAAFVPAYARSLEQAGIDAGAALRRPHLPLLLRHQIVLLVARAPVHALGDRPAGAGLRQGPEPLRRSRSTLTRITFPYLLLVSLVTLYGGMLNAQWHASPPRPRAPILLNISMVVTLRWRHYFPTAGHAAAWGVLIAGVAQVPAGRRRRRRAGVRPRFRAAAARRTTCAASSSALGPAIIGAGGVQLALFADTLIACFLPTGALSALYYADRINQLPIGVVGIAVGTVLLPEMSRRLAAGDERGARTRASARHPIGAAARRCRALAAPSVVPDLIMRALFVRGAFTAADAAAAGARSPLTPSGCCPSS